MYARAASYESPGNASFCLWLRKGQQSLTAGGTRDDPFLPITTPFLGDLIYIQGLKHLPDEVLMTFTFLVSIQKFLLNCTRACNHSFIQQAHIEPPVYFRLSSNAECTTGTQTGSFLCCPGSLAWPCMDPSASPAPTWGLASACNLQGPLLPPSALKPSWGWYLIPPSYFLMHSLICHAENSIIL